VRACGSRTRIVTHSPDNTTTRSSKTFFDELPLPSPDHHLGVGSAPRDEQVARITGRLVPVLAAESPTVVVVYGDTTSTLAGAISAVATGTVLVHVEAGLRSGDWQMPEERTRVIVDHLADLRLAPTVDAVSTLADEGVIRGVRRVGDVRADARWRCRGRPAPNRRPRRSGRMSRTRTCSRRFTDNRRPTMDRRFEV